MKVNEIISELAPAGVKPHILKSGGLYTVVMPNGQKFSGFQDIGKAQEWMKKNISVTGQVIGSPGTKPQPAAQQPAQNTNKPASTKPSSQLDPTRLKRVKDLAASKYLRFINNSALGKILKTVGFVATPIVDWATEMYAIDELYKSGAFNQYGAKANEVAQQMRTDHTRIAIQKLLVGWPAFIATLKTSSYAARLIMLAVPGTGWLGAVATTVLSSAVFALLQSDKVQRLILNNIIEEMFPDIVGNSLYNVSQTIGAAFGTAGGRAGQAVKSTVDAVKKEYMPPTNNNPAQGQSAQPAAPRKVTGWDD